MIEKNDYRFDKFHWGLIKQREVKGWWTEVCHGSVEHTWVFALWEVTP